MNQPQAPLKQFLPLKSSHPQMMRPIYEHTLEVFKESRLFSEIILITPETGGKTRQESAYKGLLACGPDTEFVVIHDAVRPFVSVDILKRNVDAVRIHHAVNTCIPTYDTINYVENDTVVNIPKRSSCMRGQTPQSFSYPLILEAHQKTKKTDAPDDCSLVLELGHPIHVVLGSDENFKITTMQDYQFACYLMEQKMLAATREL